MTDYIDKLYASGATDEDVEEFVKKQSGTKPEDYEQEKSSALTELEGNTDEPNSI